MSLHDDVEEILLDSETVANRVAELAAQLTADYAGRDPVLVSVLKGALVFLADLMRAMDLPSSIDLMEVSSYGAATEIVRAGPHPQGPVEADRGARPHHRRGHHRHRPDAQLPPALSLGAQPGLDPGLLPARQARATAGRDPDRLHRLHDPGSVRHRLRPRLQRALSQPALHRRAEAIGLRRRATGGLNRWTGADAGTAC